MGLDYVICFEEEVIQFMLILRVFSLTSLKSLGDIILLKEAGPGDSFILGIDIT
jgi:hypothetical protein